MSEKLWAKVDRYLCDLLVPTDAALEAALQSSADAGLPAIQVAPNQGKLLMLLAQIQGARDILEIGTLGGYSTIWLARGLRPGGRVVTLEAEPKHAEVARANLARAGLASVVEVREGPALETLPQLESGSSTRFDFTFIDADKASTTEYFQWALKLSRPGALIVVDNVVRDGEVIQEYSEDAGVEGMRRFLRALAAETRVTATALQTVGSKSYDGFAIARVRDPI